MESFPANFPFIFLEIKQSWYVNYETLFELIEMNVPFLKGIYDYFPQTLKPFEVSCTDDSKRFLIKLQNYHEFICKREAACLEKEQ